MSGRGRFRIEPFKHRVELDGQVREGRALASSPPNRTGAVSLLSVFRVAGEDKM